MAKSLKGTKTEKNLLIAFAGESQARNRYTYYASAAKKEGYEQIAGVFEETANQEKEHAKRLFEFLEGGAVEITASYPAGVIGATKNNLMDAINGEHEEWSEMYPSFADIADAEGFPVIAQVMREIARAEVAHEQQYKKLWDRLDKNNFFKSDEEIEWQCRNCGYVHTGNEAPQACPACAHPQAHFEPRKSNL